MDFSIAAQLGVDLLLFGMIALLLIRDRTAPEPDDEERPPVEPPPPVDTAALEALLDDMARMVNRAEKVAVRLETAGKEAARMRQEMENRPRPAPTPPPQTKAKPTPAPKEEYDESVYQAAVKLIKKGHSDDAIGQKVGLPPHEVGLIRRMGI